MSDVFVSHSSKDKEIADKVVEFLEGRGLSCWIAPRDIVPGSDWAASITTAITASKVCLLIFSENSAASSQVARELSLAETKNNVFVVPYKVDNVELSGTFEYYLTSAHWISANYAKNDYKLEELYNLIAGITGKSVQNITNITNIDNLHIHTDGDPIAAAEKVGQMPLPAASPAPSPAPNAGAGRSKLPLYIGIGAACLVLVAGGIGAAAALGKHNSEPQETVSLLETTEAAVTAETAAETAAPAAETAAQVTAAETAAETTEAARDTVTDQEVTVECWGFDTYTGPYTGEVDADGLPDGKGTFDSSWEKDGGAYSVHFEGSFAHGVVSGEGKTIFVTPDNTEITECTFVNGFANGDGTQEIDYPDRTFLYKGGFVDGKWEGENTSLLITYPDSYYTVLVEGERRNDSLVGEVKKTVENDPLSVYSTEIYNGEWDAASNDFTGVVKKTATLKDGGSLVEQGEWANSNFNGEGSFTVNYIPPVGDEMKTTEIFEGTLLSGSISSGTLTVKYADGTSTVTRDGSWDANGKYIGGSGTVENYDASGSLIN